MPKIKPCPFCGGNAYIGYAHTDDGTKTISVICDNCKIGIFRARTNEDEWNAWESANDALNAWNRRAGGV